jgi:nitroreductase
MNEPKFVRVADGVMAQVIERTGIDPVTRRERSPLPSKLEPLLLGLRVTRQFPAQLFGARRACTDAEHQFEPWRLGVYAGRELRLSLCPFCGVVEVRDVSLDLLPGVSAGRLGPRRRNDVLGWYSGRREGGRTYL